MHYALWEDRAYRSAPRRLQGGPARAVIEFDAYFAHRNQQMVLLTREPEAGKLGGGYEHNYFKINGRSSGIEHRDHTAVKSTNQARQVNERLVPIRIMVGGSYTKRFWREPPGG